MIDKIKQLREMTGIGMMDCKSALKEAKGDTDKALDILRKKGITLAAKKADRAAGQGKIESYVHMGGKIGVLVEVNCETDFVAKNEDFKTFTRDIAMQVAATDPRYLARENIPEEVIRQERDAGADIEKFYKEACLLEQAFIKNEKVSIKGLLTQLIAKIGENIVIRRFVRYKVGEKL